MKLIKGFIEEKIDGFGESVNGFGYEINKKKYTSFYPKCDSFAHTINYIALISLSSFHRQKRQVNHKYSVSVQITGYLFLPFRYIYFIDM